ncbi:hypothetical protein [Motilibacter aurantiacus]|uniref:hypothetical protein n=1 Tax=Motilibacter aurantiacus TaxID=2714955 RepID=UPI00140D0C08|nr:hypothetical protein [Motilibacter aurantiacus]NHC44990.1 hypothetical protein [Motilibacter aurantiacus]
MAGADEKDKLGLTVTQVAAGALAAVSASVASSFLGVAGTVIGAAVMSVVATTGSAIYGLSLRRGQERLAQTLRRPAMGPDEGTAPTQAMPVAPAGGTPPEGASERGLSRRAWLSIAGAALAVFLVAMVVVTSFEAIAGRPLSSLFGDGSSGGTSVTRLVGEGSGSTDDEPTAPASSPSPQASDEATPGSSPSGAPTPEATPSASHAPDASSSPAVIPSSSATPEATPTLAPTPSAAPSTSAPAAVPAEPPAPAAE